MHYCDTWKVNVKIGFGRDTNWQAHLDSATHSKNDCLSIKPSKSIKNFFNSKPKGLALENSPHSLDVGAAKVLSFLPYPTLPLLWFTRMLSYSKTCSNISIHITKFILHLVSPKMPRFDTEACWRLVLRWRVQEECRIYGMEAAQTEI